MISITADELPRFMACNGSINMEVFESSIPTDSADRDEGVAAHWVIEQVWRGEYTVDELIDRQAPNNVFITQEMIEYVTPYIESITGRGEIEVDTSFTDGVSDWEVNARADHVEFADRTIIVRDFKYGWGLVEPENNWTLLAHAIGYSIHLVHEQGVDLLKDVSNVRLEIHQPRPHHFVGKVRAWIISPQQLIDYHKKLKAALSNPSDTLNTSEYCKKCPSMVYCPAFKKAQFNVLDECDRAFKSELDNDALSFMLDNLKRAQDICKQAYDAYADLAKHRLKEGQIIENYSAQNDLTNKQWKSNVTADMVLALTGVDVTKPQMITPTQAARAGVPDAVIESLSERRNKGFKLIRADANKLATKLFN